MHRYWGLIHGCGNSCHGPTLHILSTVFLQEIFWREFHICPFKTPKSWLWMWKVLGSNSYRKAGELAERNGAFNTSQKCLLGRHLSLPLLPAAWSHSCCPYFCCASPVFLITLKEKCFFFVTDLDLISLRDFISQE